MNDLRYSAEREAAVHTLSFFPDIDLSVDDFLVERNRVQDALWPTVPLLPGIRKLVHHLKKYNIPMAVATSSRRRNFELKTGHLQDVFGCFEGKTVCGDDARHNMQGKPAPDIFLVTAGAFLGRDVGNPRETATESQIQDRRRGLVFEDAIPGVIAGKRAGMSGMRFSVDFMLLINLTALVIVVWVPDPNLLKLDLSNMEEKPDQILGSLENFVPEEWGLPPYDA